MTDIVKEEIRTRWAPHELEMVALRMVQLQAANPGLGDLEAVRLAQTVLERQRVINQWQNAKRLDPILARLRAELAAGTLDVSVAGETTTNNTAGDEPKPAKVPVLAAATPAPTPIPVIKDTAPALAKPIVHAAPILAIAPATVIEQPAPASAQPCTIAQNMTISEQAESMALIPPKASDDSVHEASDDGVDADLAHEKPVSELPVIVITTFIEAPAIEDRTDIVENFDNVDNTSTNEGEGAGFDDEDIVIDIYANEKSVVASPAPEHDIVDVPAPIAEIASTPLPIFDVAPEPERVNVSTPEFVVEPVGLNAVVGRSLPTAGEIQRALVAALSALVLPEALDNVLRSLAIEGPLDNLSLALEKAFADECAGVLDQKIGAYVASDTKIFVAGFAGNEQKSIEAALGSYDLRVWKPSQGPQAFESMAKACTIAVISEAMGDEVDDLLRSLKIRVVQHQGSTSRLAERIAEMA